MTHKAAIAAGLVLAGVAAVIVADRAFGDSTPARMDRQLTIQKIVTDDAVSHFEFTETVKLNVKGSDIGTARFAMQTKSLIDGSVQDLQFQEINLRDGPEGSTFIVTWQNFAIGPGALVEFFVFDQNDFALAENKAVTVGV